MLSKPLVAGILVVVVLALIAGGISLSVNRGNQVAADALAVRAAACAAGDCLIGDPGPGGGIVFYDAGSNQPWGRYLEAAPELPEEVWCDVWSLDVVSGTTEEIGAGAANTKLIAAACGSGAANTVSDYEGGGKADWFLPSADELNALYEQQAKVGGVGAGGYWSSSQGPSGEASYQGFTPGFQHGYYEGAAYGVRPVRAF